MRVMERIDQLVLMAPGGLQHVVSLGQSPLSVGRAPTNDLVLSNGHVSWNHLLLWVDAEGAWVKDLGSSNGTFVNDARSTGPTKLRTGDTLRVGTEFELKVGLREVTRREDRPRAYVVEAPELGVRVPIRSDRIRIGFAANCHLKVESLPPNAATLMVFDGGELSLGMNEEDHPIELGEVFIVGGLSLKVVEVDPTRAPTISPSSTHYGYHLTAAIDGPTGPEATLRDLRGGASHHVVAGNRAILLYLLGRQIVADTEAGLAEGERGWCSDEDIKLGVWGRSKSQGNPGGLHVLVHRLRKELEDAGLDAWCIEKRRRFIRIRVERVEIT